MKHYLPLILFIGAVVAVMFNAPWTAAACIVVALSLEGGWGS